MQTNILVVTISNITSFVEEKHLFSKMYMHVRKVDLLIKWLAYIVKKYNYMIHPWLSELWLSEQGSP